MARLIACISAGVAIIAGSASIALHGESTAGRLVLRAKAAGRFVPSGAVLLQGLHHDSIELPANLPSQGDELSLPARRQEGNVAVELSRVLGRGGSSSRMMRLISSQAPSLNRCFSSGVVRSAARRAARQANRCRSAYPRRGGDVGMVHHRQRLPFGLEASQHRLRVYAGFDKLQRHLAPHGLRLFGDPHLRRHVFGRRGEVVVGEALLGQAVTRTLAHPGRRLIGR